MKEKELERKNPCGNDKEIDEYLDGTICEIEKDEEEINDIKAPDSAKFDVDAPEEPQPLEDEYLKK